MGKMKELLKTSDIVLDVLRNVPATRNSDNKLFVEVYKRIATEKGIHINNVSVTSFFLNMDKVGFPATETIRRTRQKLQNKHPELKACNEVQQAREENEHIFKKFSKQ